MANLVSHVYATDPNGVFVCLPPGPAPDWAQKVITNPSAWDDLPAIPVEENPYVPPVGEDVEVDSDDVAGGRPPVSGPGSGLKAWVAYAEALDIDTEGMTKADLVAAVEANEG